MLPVERASTLPRQNPVAEALVNGIVYTPPVLAQWVAGQLVRYLDWDPPPLVVDPAVGEGALLGAVAERLSGHVQLAGVDIDTRALVHAGFSLPSGALLLQADALRPKPSVSALTGWRHVLPGEVDAVIMNPPWGATLRQSRLELSHAGFTLCRGQFDSYDVFVELGLRLVRDGGVVAAILPDSLFHPEHEPLRRLLLESSRLLSIARLGEGFFPGIYRGAAVVMFRKQCPDDAVQVGCFRLTKAWRREVLTGVVSLSEVQKHLSHSVPQARFTADASARFDLDVRIGDQRPVNVIERAGHEWARWVESGRGVELSKSGLVLMCTACSHAAPKPRNGVPQSCTRCGAKEDDLRVESIIRRLESPPPTGKWHPLIVGEDVNRYSVAPSRMIRLGVNGINYKAGVAFDRPKLLIRKTGVGIKAAVDNSGSLTNQVVFHYMARNDAPPFVLDYLEGVLSSRTLLAFHLKRVGEFEWRSHPYLTQRVINSLPIPDPTESEHTQKLAEAIAKSASLFRQTPSPELDLRIEGLVLSLYGLNSDDSDWIRRVLEYAESLEHIRLVKVDDWSVMRPLEAD
jgi:hypothetical protein